MALDWDSTEFVDLAIAYPQFFGDHIPTVDRINSWLDMFSIDPNKLGIPEYFNLAMELADGYPEQFIAWQVKLRLTGGA
jgi:hypothetical protein